MKHTLLLLLIVLAGTLQAQQQYKIVYNVYEDTKNDNYEIYSMNMDGTGKKNLTSSPGVEWVYAAYEDKVYFISDKDTCHRCYFLYEMDAAGNHVRKITDLQLEDSWMSTRKNGTEILVTGRIGKQVRNQLFLVNMQTGAYEQLTHDTLANLRDPLFLPGSDDFVIAYRPDKTTRKTVPEELWKFSLLKDASGKHKLSPGIQLTRFPAADTSTQWYEYHAGPPQWNSRESFISYMSRQQQQGQIFAVTPDGKKQWQLTPFGEHSNGWHSWSSDGRWLAVDRSTHDGKTFDIWLIDYETKNEIQLTNDPKAEMAPVIVKNPVQ